ncbi:MAG: hypothetical protein Q8O31_00175 [Rhodocyclaceae bacterium]|nr:hypothetical protein [Rhodocyclaceae bacterium]
MKHAPLTPIPSPTLPLKGRERCSPPPSRGGRDALLPLEGEGEMLLPLQGGGWEGDGECVPR